MGWKPHLVRLLAPAVAVSLVAAACGSDEASDDADGALVLDDSTAAAASGTPESSAAATADTATATSAPATTVAAPTVDLDCLLWAGETSTAVPCDQQHNAQVAGAVELPDDLPDGDLERSVAMFKACLPSVETMLGRPIEGFDVQVGYTTDVDDDGQLLSPVTCLISVGTPNLLTASLVDTPLEEALGAASILWRLEPGDCFTFADESFDYGYVVDCSSQGALIAIGTFDSDIGEWDEDALRAERDKRCGAMFDQSGIEANRSNLSGTFTNELAWLGRGARTTTCDATPN